MHMMPDFVRLRRIPIERVCNLLNLKLKKHGNQLRGSCPICHHKSERCFTVTPLPVNRWWCFGGCRDGGDGLELYSRVTKVTVYVAAKELEKTLGSH